MKSEITVGIETITPKAASKMLESSVGNFRNIDKGRVAKYAAEMISGKWLFNGETMKLSGTCVIDGQHRLAAIVKSGVTVECVVIRNLDKMTGVTIDCGKGRTLSDWAKYRGIKNAASVTSMARNVVLYNAGRWGSQNVSSCYTKDSDIVEYIELHNEQLQAAQHIADPCRAIVPRSFLGALLVIACGGRPPSENNMCNWFCDALHSGIGLNEGEPVLVLRNKLVGVEKSRRESRFLQKMVLTLAWNKTIKGERVKLLKYALTGPSAANPINTIDPAPWE
jgi:hypothetical protein